APPPPVSAPAQTPARKVEVRSPGDSIQQVPGTVPYRVSDPRVSKKLAKNDLHAKGAHAELCRLIAEVVKLEGPVHVEVATRRLRQAWKLDRANDRVWQAVEKAITDCEGRKQLQRRGEFLWPAKEAPVPVRIPDPKNATTNRDIEHIPPEELQAGL